MYKASGFDINVTVPAVTDGRKVMKQLVNILPKGSSIRLRAVERSLQDDDIESGMQTVIGVDNASN